MKKKKLKRKLRLLTVRSVAVREHSDECFERVRILEREVEDLEGGIEDSGKKGDALAQRIVVSDNDSAKKRRERLDSLAETSLDQAVIDLTSKIDERVESLDQALIDLTSKIDERVDAAEYRLSSLDKAVHEVLARLEAVEKWQKDFRPVVLDAGFRRFHGMKESILAHKEPGTLGFHELADPVIAAAKRIGLPTTPRSQTLSHEVMEVVDDHTGAREETGGELGFHCEYCHRNMAIRLESTHLCRAMRDLHVTPKARMALTRNRAFNAANKTKRKRAIKSKKRAADALQAQDAEVFGKNKAQKKRWKKS